MRLLTRPLLWRVPAWAAVIVATTLAVNGVQDRVWAAVTMTIAAIATQFTDDVHAVARTSAAIVIATVSCLACVLIAPKGLGEIPAFIVAGKIPFAIDRQCACSC
jgi:hypothetical protein